jgi:hypothetical protein
MKLFGGGVTLPDPKVNIDNLYDKRHDLFEQFKKVRDDLADIMEKYEDANGALKNGVKRMADIYVDDDFGLDRKNKDDAKKLDQAHKLYKAFFDNCLKGLTENEKAVDELQKHLVQLSRYKGPGK